MAADQEDIPPAGLSGAESAREKFLERVRALIDARAGASSSETVTGVLGPDGAWGTDDDVVRVLVELLLVPAANSDAPLPTPWTGPGRMTENAGVIDLADAMGRGDLAAWQALYARASTDAAFRQQLRRATAMVDTDVASSAALWRSLLDRLLPLLEASDETPMLGADGALAAMNRALHVAQTSHRLFGVPWASWDGTRVVMTAPDELPSALDLPAMDRVSLLERGVKALLVDALSKRMLAPSARAMLASSRSARVYFFFSRRRATSARLTRTSACHMTFVGSSAARRSSTSRLCSVSRSAAAQSASWSCNWASLVRQKERSRCHSVFVGSAAARRSRSASAAAYAVLATARSPCACRRAPSRS